MQGVRGHRADVFESDERGPHEDSHLMRQLPPDVNYLDKASLYRLLGDSFKDSRELGEGVPGNEEEILRFLDSTVLEEQPTEVLVKLAEKLKERRSQLYPEGKEEEDPKEDDENKQISL